MKIHIIGGGVIGLCSAWFLHQAGFEVVVIDQNTFSEGTSYGNAGLIVPSHFVPLASPGAIRKAIHWILNRNSPFSIRPRFNPELVRWLWQFYRSSTPENVNRASLLLKDFHELSKTLYRQFSEMDPFQFNFEMKGLLMVYQTAEAEKEEQETAVKANKLGIETLVLDSSEIRDFDKATLITARGAVFYPGDAHLNPGLFMHQFVKLLKSAGVRFISNVAVRSFEKNTRQIERLILSNGTRIQTEEVVIAAGSWSGQLASQLGIRLLLQAGKGYSITYVNPKIRPSVPSILSEAKVAITPMGDHLRVGGTLEIGNLTGNINKNRLKGILQSIPRYYPGLGLSSPNLKEVWQGYRPCTPDGLPYIGRVSDYTNLTIATGHAMMGMSLGPATGLIVSEIICGKPLSLDLSLFAPGRFW